jgi:phosphatidate cytidylyltransferase
MFFLRLISWIILVGLFFASIFIKEGGKYILLLMFVFGSFMATHEVLSMLEKLKYKSFKKLGAFCAALSVAFVFFGDPKYNLIPLVLLIIGCWGYLLVCKDKEENLKKIAVSAGGVLLGLLPIFFLSKIYNIKTNELNIVFGSNIWIGPKLLLYLVAVTKIGDTFAYITGMLSNKILKGKNHKIVPSISPKKSWEGTIGGMIFSVIVSCLLYGYLFNENNLFISLIAGIFLFWGGFFGDLAESALKRTCGVKDSGNILPGMGGVYDLLDSFIFNAPLFYFCILL